MNPEIANKDYLRHTFDYYPEGIILNDQAQQQHKTNLAYFCHL
jgi:hypothetical protein